MKRLLLILFCICTLILCGTANPTCLIRGKAMLLAVQTSEKMQSGVKKETDEDTRKPAALPNTTISKKSREHSSTVAFLLPISIMLLVIMSLSLAGFIRYRRLYKREQAAMSLLQNKYNADVSFFKDKEFLMKILEMEERNVLVNKLVTKLNKIKDKQPKEYQGWMTLATIEVEKYKVPDLWDVFEHDFVKLHPQFKKDLNSKFPDLTDNEYKVCALIRVNFKTKDISEITGVSVKSIEAIRTRLRKRFDLSSTDVLLGDYLNQFE